MSDVRAARIIRRGLDRGRAMIAFPRVLYYGLLLTRLLPRRWTDAAFAARACRRAGKVRFDVRLTGRTPDGCRFALRDCGCGLVGTGLDGPRRFGDRGVHSARAAPAGGRARRPACGLGRHPRQADGARGGRGVRLGVFTVLSAVRGRGHRRRGEFAGDRRRPANRLSTFLMSRRASCSATSASR